MGNPAFTATKLGHPTAEAPRSRERSARPCHGKSVDSCASSFACSYCCKMSIYIPVLEELKKPAASCRPKLSPGALTWQDERGAFIQMLVARQLDAQICVSATKGMNHPGPPLPRIARPCDKALSSRPGPMLAAWRDVELQSLDRLLARGAADAPGDDAARPQSQSRGCTSTTFGSAPRRRRRLSPPLLCRCHQTSCQPRDRHRQSLYHPPNPRLCRRCHRSLTPASLHACELARPRARPRKPACALCLRRCCGLHGEARARGRAGAERHQTGWVAADPSHSPPGPITCEWRRHAAALHSRTALPTAARDGAVSTVREYM